MILKFSHNQIEDVVEVTLNHICLSGTREEVAEFSDCLVSKNSCRFKRLACSRTRRGYIISSPRNHQSSKDCVVFSDDEAKKVSERIKIYLRELEEL